MNLPIVHGIRIMSKSHDNLCHVIILHIWNYCEPPLIKKHYLWDLNLAVLSVAWKETHTCSINWSINDIRLIWQSM